MSLCKGISKGPSAMERFIRTCARHLEVILICGALGIFSSLLESQEPRWSEARANQWYQQQPWLVGANYLPSDAVNELEMWQAATFNPAEIDREFGWAEGAGMNTMRVFLHNLLWEQDPAGFKQRMDQFLAIASKHHIRPMFVLFDSCWDPDPKLGPQHPPVPGVHNSGWVQAPGRAILCARSYRSLCQRPARPCLGCVERTG
jgi:hypothetical protein